MRLRFRWTIVEPIWVCLGRLSLFPPNSTAESVRVEYLRAVGIIVESGSPGDL